MKNYDPNARHEFPLHVVKLTFQQWAYKTTMTVRVGGNCMGHSVIETALSSVYGKLEENEYGEKYVVLKKPKADLMCADEDGGEEEWLGNMLVKSEILALEKDLSRQARRQSGTTGADHG